MWVSDGDVAVTYMRQWLHGGGYTLVVSGGDEAAMAWAPDYITAAELKSYARISDSDDDVFVADAVAAASRAIDRHCYRQFGQVAAAEERWYTAQWDRRIGRWIIPIDDLMTATGLVVANAETGIAITEYRREPRNASAKGRPWEFLTVGSDSTTTPDTTVDGILVTGVWGWTFTPATVKTAAKLQANRFLSRRDSPLGVAGSPDLGSELRLLAKVDADLKPMLAGFVRRWAVAPTRGLESAWL